MIHRHRCDYPYTAPFCNTIYCGTHPQSATVGWTELAEVKAQFEILTSLYITRLSGTYPHVKTAFGEVRSVILMQPYPDAAAYNAPQSGEGITGLHPGRATEGWVVDAAIVPGGDISDAVYKGKFSGTEPGISTVSGLVHAPVEADARAIAVSVHRTIYVVCPAERAHYAIFAQRVALLHRHLFICVVRSGNLRPLAHIAPVAVFLVEDSQEAICIEHLLSPVPPSYHNSSSSRDIYFAPFDTTPAKSDAALLNSALVSSAVARAGLPCGLVTNSPTSSLNLALPSIFSS